MSAHLIGQHSPTSRSCSTAPVVPLEPPRPADGRPSARHTWARLSVFLAGMSSAAAQYTRLSIEYYGPGSLVLRDDEAYADWFGGRRCGRGKADNGVDRR